MKYQVFLTNFGFPLQEEFDTIDEAIQCGRNSGFEYQIIYNHEVVYSQGIFS